MTESLRFTLHFARNLPQIGENLLHCSTPFATLHHGSKELWRSPASETLNPVWEEQVQLEIERGASPLKLLLWDPLPPPLVGQRGFLGCCELDLSRTKQAPKTLQNLQPRKHSNGRAHKEDANMLIRLGRRGFGEVVCSWEVTASTPSLAPAPAPPQYGLNPSASGRAARHAHSPGHVGLPIGGESGVLSPNSSSTRHLTDRAPSPLVLPPSFAPQPASHPHQQQQSAHNTNVNACILRWVKSVELVLQVVEYCARITRWRSPAESGTILVMLSFLMAYFPLSFVTPVALLSLMAGGWFKRQQSSGRRSKPMTEFQITYLLGQAKYEGERVALGCELLVLQAEWLDRLGKPWSWRDSQLSNAVCHGLVAFFVLGAVTPSVPTCVLWGLFSWHPLTRLFPKLRDRRVQRKLGGKLMTGLANAGKFAIFQSRVFLGLETVGYRGSTPHSPTLPSSVSEGGGGGGTGGGAGGGGATAGTAGTSSGTDQHSPSASVTTKRGPGTPGPFKEGDKDRKLNGRPILSLEPPTPSAQDEEMFGRSGLEGGRVRAAASRILHRGDATSSGSDTTVGRGSLEGTSGSPQDETKVEYGCCVSVVLGPPTEDSDDKSIRSLIHRVLSTRSHEKGNLSRGTPILQSQEHTILALSLVLLKRAKEVLRYILLTSSEFRSVQGKVNKAPEGGEVAKDLSSLSANLAIRIESIGLDEPMAVVPEGGDSESLIGGLSMAVLVREREQICPHNVALLMRALLQPNLLVSFFSNRVSLAFRLSGREGQGPESCQPSPSPLVFSSHLESYLQQMSHPEPSHRPTLDQLQVKLAALFSPSTTVGHTRRRRSLSFGFFGHHHQGNRPIRTRTSSHSKLHSRSPRNSRRTPSPSAPNLSTRRRSSTNLRENSSRLSGRGSMHWSDSDNQVKSDNSFNSMPASPGSGLSGPTKQLGLPVETIPTASPQSITEAQVSTHGTESPLDGRAATGRWSENEVPPMPEAPRPRPRRGTFGNLFRRRQL